MKQIHTLVKSTLLVLLLVGSLALPTLTKYLAQSPHATKITIGILQTASHPALDNAREGFIQEIKAKLGDSVTFILKNGQGSLADLHTLAVGLHEDTTISAFYAIATPAAQALAQIEKEKPIIIAAVTDLKNLDIIPSDRNICGSCDRITTEDHIHVIKNLIPHAKTVGLIYNNAEVNSVGLIKEMEKKLSNEGITSIKIGVTIDAEIPTALQANLASIDLLWAPTDNTIASAISYIAHQMRLHKKPLMVSFECNEALCSAGIDYYQAGKQSAQSALEILMHHKKPSELEIIKPIMDHIQINEEILHELNLVIPEPFKNKITYVTNKKGTL